MGCNIQSCNSQVPACESLSRCKAYEIWDEPCCSEHCRQNVRDNRLSDLGDMEEVGDLLDVQRSKVALQLAGGAGCRVSKFFEEDGEQPARVLRAEAAFPPGSHRAEAHFAVADSEAAEATEAACAGGWVELMARTDFPGLRCHLGCGQRRFATFSPTKSLKLYRFECPQVHVESVDISFDDAQEASLQLSVGFGLRLRGQDLLSGIRVCSLGEDKAVLKDVEDVDAFKSALSMQAAQHGALQALPRGLGFRAETAVEFLAYGRTGKEELDVYVNGLTVSCASKLQLGHGEGQRRLYRFALVPASCEIRSLVIRARPGEGGRVVVDRSYGVRLGGHDALQGVVFVDPMTCVMNPFQWDALSPEQSALQGGLWAWDGFYYLLAYKRTKKPHAVTPRRPVLLGEKHPGKVQDSKPAAPEAPEAPVSDR
ncbi:unnamed protein product [Effrenium voratum]|nr:unnamed protein product [Effrenium voratum]